MTLDDAASTLKIMIKAQVVNLNCNMDTKKKKKEKKPMKK